MKKGTGHGRLGTLAADEFCAKIAGTVGAEENDVVGVAYERMVAAAFVNHFDLASVESDALVGLEVGFLMTPTTHDGSPVMGWTVHARTSFVEDDTPPADEMELVRSMFRGFLGSVAFGTRTITEIRNDACKALNTPRKGNPGTMRRAAQNPEEDI